MANGLQLDPTALKELTRLGAQARLNTLDTERSHLMAFLGTPEKRPRSGAHATAAAAEEAADEPVRKRSRMSPAARKAVSKRMKAYWAGRRKA